jgi:inosose dehydratase
MNRRELLATGIGALALLAGRGRPGQARAPRVRLGYAAITWGAEDRRAMDDIAALGFGGIQLRTSAVEEWGDRPEALRELLEARGLTMAAFSSGTVGVEPDAEADDRVTHLRHARFVRDVGGLYLQVIDRRPRDREPTGEDFRRMGHLLTELGRRTSDLGVPLGYHHHMGSLGEAPDEIARILDATDPRWVGLVLDTAHYRQGGGDPAAAAREYGDRLLFLHLKDVESPVPGRPADSYRFVELGRGGVDFPAFFAALEAVGFDGWGIVELDRVPDPARTPKESGAISRDYLETLGLRP